MKEKARKETSHRLDEVEAQDCRRLLASGKKQSMQTSTSSEASETSSSRRWGFYLEIFYVALRSSVKAPPPWHDQIIHWMSHCILHFQKSCWTHHNKWCKVESVSISSSLQWGPEVACTSTSRHTSAFGLCATSGSNLCPCGPCMTKLFVCEASWRGHVFWSLAADSAPIGVHRRFQSNRTVPRRSNLGTRFSQPARQSKGYLKCFAGSVYEPSSKIQALRSIFKSEPHKVKCSECAFTISSSYSSRVSLIYVF